LSITKIYSRRVEKDLNYATTEDLMKELRVFEAQMGWSIFAILDILKQRKADSLSITKEKPFRYFYARLSGKTIIIRLQTSEQETGFKIPIEEFKE
jgi:hypothetical protein